MENLKDTLKSTKQWEWSKTNEGYFVNLKEHIMSDCEKGINAQ